MARNPTPAERETLLALRDGPILWGTAPGARLTVLRRLNELGLIESSGAFEAKGAYQITPAGRAALAAEEGPRPSLTEAIEAVRQAGGKDWDKIADVQEYLGRKEDGELARLRAENERLRAALEAIAKGAPTTKPEWGDYYEHEANGYDMAHYDLAKIASEALAAVAQAEGRETTT